MLILNEDDAAKYLPSIGLLSVHSSIALADALLVAEEGKRSSGDNHADAADKLQTLCKARGIEAQGVRHFRDLLGMKTPFSYGDGSVPDRVFQAAKLKMDQFFKWVYGAFTELAELNDETEDAHA
jgi:hypothetical protein